MRVVYFALIVVGVLNIACPSYAMLITADGVTQFYDNFEGVSPGATPDNGAQPGEWFLVQEGGTIQVITGDPAEGNQYLRHNRTSGGDCNAFANLMDRQTASGTLIHAEWMMYVPTSSTYQASVLLFDQDDAIRTGLLLSRGTAGKIEYLTSAGGGTWVAASTTYTPDTWQKWTMDYVVGLSTTTFSFSIDDGAAETVAAFSGGEVGRLRFAGNGDSGSMYYLDAVPVPEPSTVALTLAGALGLLAYAWRKRK